MMASLCSPWIQISSALREALHSLDTTHSTGSIKCPTKIGRYQHSRTTRCRTRCFQDVMICPSIDPSTSEAIVSMDPHNVHAVVKNLETGNLIEGLFIADMNFNTAKLAIGIVGPFLSALGFLFILRIVMSWYPRLPVGKFPYVIAYAPTEPFLGPTRKLIPPLGGVDVTPVVWFGLLSFLNEILVGPQGILVLLSQQV